MCNKEIKLSLKANFQKNVHVFVCFQNGSHNFYNINWVVFRQYQKLTEIVTQRIPESKQVFNENPKNSRSSYGYKINIFNTSSQYFSNYNVLSLLSQKNPRTYTAIHYPVLRTVDCLKLEYNNSHVFKKLTIYTNFLVFHFVKYQISTTKYLKSLKKKSNQSSCSRVLRLAYNDLFKLKL